MPEITAYAKIFRDWEALIGSCVQHASLVPALTAYRATLEGHLENVKAARARQLALQEDCRQATREVRQMVLAGADEVRRLRNRVKAELGPRDARLHLFGIKPLPRRAEP